MVEEWRSLNHEFIIHNTNKLYVKAMRFSRNVKHVEAKEKTRRTGISLNVGRRECYDCQGFGLRSCPSCGKGGLTPEQRGER
ncbi:hypothetical protein L1987_52983 [Smallanthus sonchifolius]|uniref:Uncharacterized protein n=1 Tax=Smallanthus sonchifolius TaxID=185202 RepID=A0ACB9EVU7_9ASTR|nr:hypothetical protein L1987_52983 [Smallanthus sonchifolius]